MLSHLQSFELSICEVASIGSACARPSHREELGLSKEEEGTQLPAIVQKQERLKGSIQPSCLHQLVEASGQGVSSREF